MDHIEKACRAFLDNSGFGELRLAIANELAISGVDAVCEQAVSAAIFAYLKSRASEYEPGDMTDREEFLHRLAAEIKRNSGHSTGHSGAGSSTGDNL